MRVVGEIAYKEFEEMKALIDNKYYLNQSDFVRHAVRNEIHKKKEEEKLKLEIHKLKQEKIRKLKSEKIEEEFII
ncbi:MAG: hypothetical protein MJ224_01705 [archaeon]|nr:hypothetical protein [archaeon]